MQFKLAYSTPPVFSSHLQWISCSLTFEALFWWGTCFPCVKQFKARVARGDQSEFVGPRVPLLPQPCKRERKMLWSDAWDLSSSLFFCALIQHWWDNGDDTNLPFCCLLIVKSGLSWGICPGRALYPLLWTCSRFRFGWLVRETIKGPKLNFMRRPPRPIVLRWRRKVVG